jgi:NitT/TauT family transport system ATP-binding protein
MSSVQIRDVRKSFGNFEVLHGVSIPIEDGEFVVLVGPSGCGKSTFLRIVADLDQPTTGTITVTRPDSTPASNAMVFHGRTLFPWLSVRDNVAYGLQLSGMSKAERRERADELLDSVGLTEFASAWPHQISEGMRQRVSIARALAMNPSLLLMDEPFGALDEQTRFILQEELLRIWETSGKTVLFVTHSIDEALILADKIVIMSARPGTIREIIDVPFPRPRHLTDVRSDPQFADLFTTTWTTLRDEVESGGTFRV